MNILLGLTGGIAIVKAPQIVSLLKKACCSVRTVMTPAAAQMASPLAFEALTGAPAALDLFDRSNPAEIQHIAWAHWADAALIAPASASTIGKLACGIADNLLTTIALAMTCPILVVPAMNAAMFENAAVQDNLRTLAARGMHVMQPAAGALACGDTGNGRLPEPAAIVEELLSILRPEKALAGTRVLITAGPTREPIDPVRYISNRSSGKMGYALARAARDLGADVLLVSGPVCLDAPFGVKTLRVTTAQQMRDAVMENLAGRQIMISCAAVSDYTPAVTFEDKQPKSAELTIELVRTSDILAEAAQYDGIFTVGFAAQTHDLEKYALEKLSRKHLDMIVANDVSGSETGMESDDNEVTVFSKDGSSVHFGRASKDIIARQVVAEAAAVYLRTSKAHPQG